MRSLHAAERLAARRAVRATVAAWLDGLDDRRLRELVAAGTPLGVGIGGRAAVVEVAGTPVFVKRVPLTALELRPEHARSTANLFALPTWYQYPLGSAGFGAWRELAAHAMTTEWVLTNAYEGFPLTYHWRVLPDTPPEGFVDEFGGIDGAVAHWENSPRVRARLEAISRSPASLVLFLEYVPHTLADWLRAHSQPGTAGGADSPFPWAERALRRGTAFLRSRGMVHFDAHLANVLTDGQHLYFADLGLALSSRFALTPAETGFLTEHLAYDQHHAVGQLLRHHVLADLPGEPGPVEFLRAWPAGRSRAPAAGGAEVAALIDRHARATVALHDFHRDLLTVSKRTPFPAARLRRLAPP
ncbi:protein kinase family protein [Streptomyces sp. NPDC057702]|uniref:protein kinase family protein n=1 Tax=unclassified Streptomyces TaxID=2593676 RepID=UPI0036C17779